MIKLTYVEHSAIAALLEGKYPKTTRAKLNSMNNGGLLYRHLELIPDPKRPNGYPYRKYTWEVTVRGLESFGADPFLIAARRNLEEKRAREVRLKKAEFQQRAEERAEERKAKIIAKVRELNAFGGTDERVWDMITRIVEIHEGTT